MEPIDYGQALARGWRLVVALGVVGLVVGLLLPVSTPAVAAPLWKTTSEVGSPPPSANGSYVSPIDSGVTTDQIVYFCNSENVGRLAAQNSGLGETPAQVLAQTHCSGPGTDSNGNTVGLPGVVTVTAIDTTAARAANLNNSFTQALDIGLAAQVQAQQAASLAQVKKSIASVENQIAAVGANSPAASGLESQLSTLTSTQSQLEATAPSAGFSVLQAATPATATKLAAAGSHRITRPERGLIGLAVGVVLGLLVALVIELFDDKLRKPVRAEETFGFPVVAEVAGVGDDAASSRMLRATALLEGLAPVGREPDTEEPAVRPDAVVAGEPDGSGPRRPRFGPRQVILVASPGHEPARPYVAANLATAFAEAGQRVVVVSTADLETVAAPEAEPATGYDPAAYGGDGHEHVRIVGSDVNGAPGPEPGPGEMGAEEWAQGRNGVADGHGAGVPVDHDAGVTTAGGVDPAPETDDADAAFPLPTGRRPEPAVREAAIREAEPQSGPVGKRPPPEPAGPGYGDEPREWAPATPAELEAHLEPSRVDGVLRLSLRPFVPNGSFLVEEAPTILESLREITDTVVLEVPPLLWVDHGEALSVMADVVLVVAENGVTTFRDGRRSGELLRRLGAPVLGVVWATGQPARVPPPPAAVDEEPGDEAPGEGEPPAPEVEAEETGTPAGVRG